MQSIRRDLFLQFVFDLLYFLLPLVAAFIIAIIFPFDSPWLAALAVAVLFVGAILLTYLRGYVRAALLEPDPDVVAQLEQVTSREAAIATDRLTLEKAVLHLSDTLRDCVGEFKRINDTWQGDVSDGDLADSVANFAEVLTKRTLEKITDLWNYPTDPTQESRDARATFFKLENDQPGDFILKNYTYSYPEGEHSKTEVIRQREHPSATAIKCVEDEEIVIVSDVKKESKKADRGEPHVYEVLRAGHRHEYGSMVSFPVIAGRPRRPSERRFVGVITITVSDEYPGFFQSVPLSDPPCDYVAKTMLTKVLHAFALIIGTISEFERLVAQDFLKIGQVDETA